MPRPKTLFCNGRIVTMNDPPEPVTWVMVADGKIEHVAFRDGPHPAETPDVQVVDLAGRVLAPGFIDAHNHFALSSLQPRMADCETPPCSSLGEVIAAIASTCAATPPGAWVRAFGFHASRIREGRNPTRYELDEASPDHPVVLLDVSYHAGYANSQALRLCGFLDGAPDPVGGSVVRDESGTPTGTLLEAALDPAQRLSLLDLLRNCPDEGIGLVRETAQRHLTLGITAVGDALVTPELAALYRRCEAGDALAVTVQQLHGGKSFFARPDADAFGPMGEDHGSLLRGGTVKLFMDGTYPSPAITRHCGAGCVEHVGHTNYTYTEVATMALSAAEAGLNVAVHCGGNHAIDVALDAFELVRRRFPAKNTGLRIEHAFLAGRGQARRMADLGVALVSQPGLGAAFGDVFLSLRGEDDPDLTVFPVASMLNDGVTVALSSDNPCGGPLSPIEIMAAAVTRTMADGATFDLAEAVSPSRAHQMYTIDAARICGREREEGSIAAGKRANLVVLSRDPAGCPGAQIGDVQVLQTYVDGQLRYERPTG